MGHMQINGQIMERVVYKVVHLAKLGSKTLKKNVQLRFFKNQKILSIYSKDFPTPKLRHIMAFLVGLLAFLETPGQKWSVQST